MALLSLRGVRSSNRARALEHRSVTMRAFMLPRDIGLFIRSARTEAKIARLRARLGVAGALEAVYAEDLDPWAAAAPEYRYQRRKYEVLASLLPDLRYRRALDLGCGTGLMSRHLAARADSVLGVDIAPSAVATARNAHAGVPNVAFEVHDVMDLPRSFDGTFDLVVVADVLYYVSPLDDAVLDTIVRRIAALLVPGGVCMLVNHYFFRLDPDSRRSRRIHRAFDPSAGFASRVDHWRPFYLVTTCRTTPSQAPARDQR